MIYGKYIKVENTYFHQHVALSKTNKSLAFTRSDYSLRIRFFCATIQIEIFLKLIEALSLDLTRLFKNMCSGIDTYPFRLQLVPEKSLLAYKGWNA